MAMSAAAVGEVSQPRLPEIQLRWTDFMWSVEKLRHKSYNKSMRERDWFRINPLEMLLLGTQSLTSAEPAKKDHGTMVLVMGSLRQEMGQRPRYWLRLLQVFADTLLGKDTPPLIIQRCASSLMSLWKVLEDFPEFRPFVCARAISSLKFVELFEDLLQQHGTFLGPDLRVEIEQFVSELKELLSSSTSVTSDEVTGDELQPWLHQFCAGKESSSELVLQASLILKSSSSKFSTACLTENQASLDNLVSALNQSSAGDDDSGLVQLLSLLQILMIRYHELSPDPPVATPSGEPPAAPQEGATDSSAGGSESGEPDNVEGEGGAMVESSHFANLFDSLTHSLLKWKELSSAHSTRDADCIPEKILSLAQVILAYRPLSQSFSEAAAFFRDPMTLLMTYSTEGYLSDLPGEFLTELLEFVCSLVEQGTDPLTALQTNLPNLFGPAFGGIKDHKTSCKLLKYGYLAVCSQHKKSLLTEGLKFLMDVYHLFPPVDEVRGKERAELLHREAVEVCSDVLDQLLRSLPLCGEDTGEGGGEDTASGDGGEEEREGDEKEEGGGSSVVDQPESSATGDLMAEGEALGAESAKKAEIELPSVTKQWVWSDVEGVEPVTDEERAADREIRLCIYLALLNLACAMVRNGENVSFLFASCLPKLFTVNTAQDPPKEKLRRFFGEEPPPTSKGIPWNVDIRHLSVQVLELATLCVENNASSPFQLCGIVLPKLIKNFDAVTVSDSEKLSLVQEVLQITHKTVEAGHSIEHFVSYGIDLMSQLCPPSASSDKLREFINLMAGHFMTTNQGVLLYLIKSACQFMMTNFTDEGVEVRELFRALLFKGKRDEVRCIFKVCIQQFVEEQYHALRPHLYGYASGKLNHRQFIALCELLITAMDIAKPSKAVREVVANVEEEDEEMVRERQQMERDVVNKLTSPCLQQVEQALAGNRFKKELWEEVASKLSRIALFRTLFHNDFHTISRHSNEELLEFFQRKFPEDVLASDETMELLALSATRIEHMQTPRYDSLKTVLSSILRYFLTLDVSEPTSETTPPQGAGAEGGGAGETTPPQGAGAEGGGAGETTPPQGAGPEGGGAGETTPPQGAGAEGGGAGETTPPCGVLEIRKCKLQEYLDNLPRNKEDLVNLVAHGYSKQLWDKGVSLTVRTDGTLSLEENLRQNLLACYTEFADILKQMAVTHVSVDGEMVKVAHLFTEELSLTDLKGRRAIAVRMIDERRGGGSLQGHFYERKLALLAKEDQIEAEFEKMANADIKPKTFTVALNTEFFDCIRCCGPKIIGCYAPTGEHCERPLEIGIRCDSAVVSIYDETGQEVENVELLFTEEGAFLFKAYTNGHPYDTSQVWVSLFAALLREEASSACSLVPALIIPRGYPNQRTWETLRRTHSTEITGSLLTCQPDFSPEWRTYYDHRPERVNIGSDMILHCGFTPNTDQMRPSFRRQRSKFTKDLAGIIFEEAMQALLTDEFLKQFRFLGKVMSQYVSVCITKGEGDRSLFSTGFDYQRWSKVYKKAKQPPPLPPPLVSTDTSPPSKEAITDYLVCFLEGQILQWCSGVELAELCASNHKQLLELKLFLERGKGRFKQPQLLKELRALLTRCLVPVPILCLPDSLQEEIIHWVFRNEDRVWRYRGGRSGHETLQQFMNFLGRSLPVAPPPPAPSSPSPSPPDQSHDLRGHSSDAYAGVAVFSLPELANLQGAKFDPKTVQVKQMIGYAVGEVIQSDEEVQEEGEGPGGVTRWRPEGKEKCYEVVTTWVHPSYRGLNMSVQMYLMIIRQVPAGLVMCDLLEGSLERVITSNTALQLLGRAGLDKYLVPHRQPSYTVVTQTGVSEQFEQVVIRVRPLRVALGLYEAASWAWAHPSSLLATALVVVPLLTSAFLTLRRR